MSFVFTMFACLVLAKLNSLALADSRLSPVSDIFFRLLSLGQWTEEGARRKFDRTFGMRCKLYPPTFSLHSLTNFGINYIIINEHMAFCLDMYFSVDFILLRRISHKVA